MKIDIAHEMVTAGDQEIAALNDQIADIDRRIEDLTSELATLQSNAERRAASLVEARLAVVRTEGEHSQATAYAKLAQHKPNEHQAIKAVSAAKKAWDAAQKELARLEQEDEEQRQVAAAREADINGGLHLLRAERETHETEIHSMQAGRNKALNELGMRTYAQLLEAYQSKQSQVDNLATQLVAAQVELYDCHTSAIERLARWPDLRKKLAALGPQEDSTERMIRTALLYADVLIDDKPHANQAFIHHIVENGGPVLWDLLNIQVKWSIEQISERRALLQQALDAYHTHLTDCGSAQSPTVGGQ